MTTGKGRGAIEKLVRLRAHEEKEAKGRVADGVRLVLGLDEARQRLKEKKAGRMAAEKLLARRRSEQAAEIERKEE
jgi:hypothetical protein